MPDIKNDLKREKTVTFKPVTEGLGFHPFANGLPYAPVTKAPAISKVSQSISQALNPPAHRTSAGLSQGTGALSAGPATFLGQNLRVHVPVASSSMPLPAMPSSRRGVPGMISSAVAHAGLARSSVESTRSAVEQLPSKTQYGFDYPIKRAFAFIVDAFVNLGLGGTALVIGLWKQGLNPQMLLHSGVIWVTVLFLIFFGWALMTAQEIAFGTTLGKRLFGLYLAGSTSAVLVRALLFLPCFAVLGVLSALFDKDKRCLHDILTGIQPNEIARL